MKSLKFLTSCIVSLLLITVIFNSHAYSADGQSCSQYYRLIIEATPNPFYPQRDGDTVRITIQNPHHVLENGRYYIEFESGQDPFDFSSTEFTVQKNVNDEVIAFTAPIPGQASSFYTDYDLELRSAETTNYYQANEVICQGPRWVVSPNRDGPSSCDINFSQVNSTDWQTYQNPSCVEANRPLSVEITNMIVDGERYSGPAFIELTGLGTYPETNVTNGTLTTTLTVRDVGPGTVVVRQPANASATREGRVICSSPANMIQSKMKCTPEEQALSVNAEFTFDLCKPVENPGLCNDCLAKNGVWTALGCIRFDPKQFTQDFLKIALGIAGGIALLLMVYGAFRVSTSTGDPKGAEEGKEIITGTIAGLLFIIFSVMLLKVIGVDILQIPGF